MATTTKRRCPPGELCCLGKDLLKLPGPPSACLWDCGWLVPMD